MGRGTRGTYFVSKTYQSDPNLDAFSAQDWEETGYREA
jgi:hypothetical protein